MMKAKKILSSIFITAVAFSLTGCLSSKKENDDLIYNQVIKNCVNVFFSDDSEPYYKGGVGYQIYYNYTNQTAEINIEGLSTPSQSFTTLTFPNVPWKLSNDWKIIGITSATPVSTVATPEFRNMRIYIYDRMVTNEIYYPCVGISYDLPSMGYEVISYPPGLINTGETKVYDANGTEYVQPSTSPAIYVMQIYDGDSSKNLNLQANRTATVTIQNALFKQGMTGENLQVQNVPYHINSQGRLFMQADELKVYRAVSNTNAYELKNYKITDFNCVTDPNNYMVLTYNISITADNGVVTTYNVKATGETPKF